MDAADRAEQAYRGECNCAQAVLVATRGKVLSEESALRIARGFGGGIAGMGLTCGALTGATMAIGLRSGDQGDPVASAKTAERVGKLFAQFMDRHGCSACRDLIGLDLTDPAQAARKHADPAYTDQCSCYVRDAAAIAEQLIAAPPS